MYIPVERVGRACIDSKNSNTEKKPWTYLQNRLEIKEVKVWGAAAIVIADLEKR